MHRLDLIETLIEGSDRALDQVQQRCLSARGFVVQAERAEDRIVLGPERTYTARSKIRCWREPEGGRFVWFSLDCDIPQVSTIVASIGVPPRRTRLPMLVMNLNLKLRFDNYNVILGFRGDELAIREVDAFTPRLGAVRPELSKTAPGFAGVRSVFALAKEPIRWSVQTAEATIERWFEAFDTAPRVEPSSIERAAFARYREEMLALHAREGAGFDAIFDDGWLRDLFTQLVFPEET